MTRLNPLSLITFLAVTPSGIRVVLEGGHVFEYRRQEPSAEPPQLEPPTFTCAAEPVVEPKAPALPGLAKARPAHLALVRRSA